MQKGPRVACVFICILTWLQPGLVWSQSRSSGRDLTVSGDFEGGCAQVESIDQGTRTIRFKPETYPGQGWAYWWYMRVDGIRPGETIALDAGGKHGRFAHPEQAAFSLDGKTWKQTPRGERVKERIVYRVKVDSDKAWFAWGPPFLPSDARELVERLAAAHPEAEAFELCESREGRQVPGLRLSGQTETEAQRYGVWIQARQHAWECGASWVARGLAEWLVSDDPRAAALRARADVTVIPLMDVDSVAMGAGGKMQKPHDHNRDWTKSQHWPEVRAAMAGIARLHKEIGLDLFVDLHSPGMYNPETYYLTSPGSKRSEEGRRNLARFLDASKAEMTGPLELREEQQVAGPRYTKDWRAMSQNWVTAHTSGRALAFTLEAAWNNAKSTTDGYMALGRQLGLAMERYFRENPRNSVSAEESGELWKKR
ncbi:MAG: M14 family zinc carboxypeptidase [Candidatus Hydrogenedentes bacterium]|nr:M14 family zinc carboxypeptidase [Candidatus Hydrogenedentota bacterium]